MVVLDGSAAIRIVIASEQSSQYAAILAGADEILAPDLIIAEVTNALWKYCRAGLLTPMEVKEKLRDCLDLVDSFSELGPLALEALDLSLLLRRPAYDMFSSRYREQVSFDVWHQVIVTHWRMFHAEVLRTEEPATSGPGVSLEIYLRGADDKDYRARFLLIRTGGRWWIDDVHWAEEPNQREFSRI